MTIQHLIIQGGYDQESRLTSLDDFGFINATTPEKAFVQFEENNTLKVQLIQKVVTLSDDFYDADNVERESMVLGKNDEAIIHGFDFAEGDESKVLTKEEALVVMSNFDYEIETVPKPVMIEDEVDEDWEDDEDEWEDETLILSDKYLDTFKTYGFTFVAVQTLNDHFYLFKSKFDFEATFKELNFIAESMPYTKRGSMSYDANENTYQNKTLNKIINHMLSHPENFELYDGKSILYDGFNGDLMGFDCGEYPIGNDNFTIEKEVIDFEAIKEIPLESFISFLTERYDEPIKTEHADGIQLQFDRVIDKFIPFSIMNEDKDTIILEKASELQIGIPFIYNGEDLQTLLINHILKD